MTRKALGLLGSGAILVLAASGAHVASAQPISPENGESFIVAQAQVADVDETALRYFARQGDQRRVDAEIARLRALYPDWRPPTNLLEDDFAADPMIERIWELYGAGDFAGARAAIVEKQQAEPGWQPTEDMLSSLSIGEAAVRLRNASDIGQYETVISVATDHPGLLTCSSVDLLWRLAEAFIETGNRQRGIDAYSYILSNCDNPQERFATLQQANERLTVEELEPLLSLERGTNGTGEFEPLRLDIARESLLDVLAGRAQRAEADAVSQIEAAVAADPLPDDLRLLGWYARAQNRDEDALVWFERAMDVDPSALSANGLGVTYLDLDRFEDAEDVLNAYADEDEDIERAYLAAAAALLAVEPRIELEDVVLGRIVAAASAARSVPIGEELGWYAYGFNQPTTARAWFETTLGWDPEHEPAAYGIVVASDRMGDTTRVQAIKAQWSASSARIAQFGTPNAVTSTSAAPVPPPRPSGLIAASSGPVAATSVQSSAPASSATSVAPRPAASAITVNYQGCASYVPAGSLSGQQALTRAWCLMDMLRPAEAIENFSRALQTGSNTVRTDAAYGQALAYIRMGLAEDASVAAAAMPQTRARVIELQTSILTLTALSSYRAGDYRRTLMVLDERSLYAAEQNDLLVLRAWSYYHLRRYVEAEQIFAAVAATGHRDAAAGLAAARGSLAAQQR